MCNVHVPRPSLVLNNNYVQPGNPFLFILPWFTLRVPKADTYTDGVSMLKEKSLYMHTYNVRICRILFLIENTGFATTAAASKYKYF